MYDTLIVNTNTEEQFCRFWGNHKDYPKNVLLF